MSEPPRASVLAEHNLFVCDDGKGLCDHWDCIGERSLADEVIRLRAALTLANQRAEAAEGERDAWAKGFERRAMTSEGRATTSSEAQEMVAGLFARVEQAEAERDALRKDAATCEWHDDDPSEMDGLYSTQCKRLFQLNEPGIEYNGLKFCPYCGGSIVYTPPEAEPDEDDDAALAVQP